MRLHPSVGLDDLLGKGRRRQNLRHQRIRIQRNRRDQLLQLVGSLLGVGRRLRALLVLWRRPGLRALASPLIQDPTVPAWRNRNAVSRKKLLPASDWTAVQSRRYARARALRIAKDRAIPTPRPPASLPDRNSGLPATAASRRPRNPTLWRLCGSSRSGARCVPPWRGCAR